jgi:hypothetical protein
MTVGLCYVEDPTFSKMSAHRWRWGCHPYTTAVFLVHIYVRGWVDLRIIERLEGLGQLKNSVTLSLLDPATFLLVTYCLNRIHNRVPRVIYIYIYIYSLKFRRDRDLSRWPRGSLYPQKLALNSSTSGGRSVVIVRSRTQATEFFLLCWRMLYS